MSNRVYEAIVEGPTYEDSIMRSMFNACPDKCDIFEKCYAARKKNDDLCCSFSTDKVTIGAYTECTVSIMFSSPTISVGELGVLTTFDDVDEAVQYLLAHK